MSTKAHQALRDYIAAVRGNIASEDEFGLFLLRLFYRDGRISAGGMFRRVRTLCDAVTAIGGTHADARAWASQAIRWWKTGKAIEQKFARFEVDPQTSKAMNDLIKFLQTLPDDLVAFNAPWVPSSPFGKPNPFATPPPAPQPSSRPSFGSGGNPFGNNNNNNNSSFGNNNGNNSPFGNNNNNNSPFGNKPGQPPQPPQRTPFGSRFGPPADPVPYHVGLCFDALGAKPFPPPKPPETPLSDLFDDPPMDVCEDLDSKDLKGLLECWHKLTDKPDRASVILREIGKRKDMRALDHMYSLSRDTEGAISLTDVFTVIGGDVGIAGLMTLLPIQGTARTNWLSALSTILKRDRDTLSDTSVEMLEKIALAETAQNVPFSASAVQMLAGLRRLEAIPVLWEHARASDTTRSRIALYALAQFEPNEETHKMEELLNALGNLPDVLTTTSNAPEPTHIRIPFEQLHSMLYSYSHKPKAAIGAMLLIGYLENDDRVIPTLILQLNRRVSRLRAMALAHLRRLKATQAADSVAKIMEKDQELAQKAAEILCEWGDPRCVPVLMKTISAESVAQIETVIRWLGKLPHVAFDQWLMKVVDTQIDLLGNGVNAPSEQTERATDAEDTIVKIIEVLVEIDSRNLQAVAERLIASSSVRIRLAVARSLVKMNTNWARNALRKLACDRTPLVSYVAITLLKDDEFSAELLKSSHELYRLLGVRMLWAAKDAQGVLPYLEDKSAAVRDVALWALANLKPTDQPLIDELWRQVDREDKIDMWHLNPGVIAWRGLAAMGLTIKETEAVANAG